MTQLSFNLNSFLIKGNYVAGINLIYGPAASGKTTCCLLASISMAKEGKKVIFIDTENGFSIERLKQLCADDYNNIIDNIFLLKIKSFEDQKEKLYGLFDLIKEGKFSLVVIDTLVAYYRQELRKDVKKVNLELIEQLKILKYITRRGLPILITTQVYSKMDNKGSIESVGGKMVKNFSKVLIELKKYSDGRRKAILLKPKQKEMSFKIGKRGFIQV